MHDLVVIALTSPLIIGIYKDKKLIETIKSDGRSSEVLPEIFKTLLSKYQFEHIVYASGPGSFMAIKVSYIFLRTLCLVKNIPLLATDAFYFNDNAPIKAVGKLYFVKNRDTIETQSFSEVPAMEFTLPQDLKLEDFSKETAPFYGIGAVG
jgi:tRNA A37 threonylcarbamoyladenosine modification protein TsaB